MIEVFNKKSRPFVTPFATLQSRVAGTSLVAAWGFGRFAKEASAGKNFPVPDFDDPAKNQRNDGFAKSSRCKARQN
jgi:hypothetical protein